MLIKGVLSHELLNNPLAPCFFNKSGFFTIKQCKIKYKY